MKIKIYGSKQSTFKSFAKPLNRVPISKIARSTKVDEYSKKLKLDRHLWIQIQHVIEDCESLNGLCNSLKGNNARKRGIIDISKGQLSTVNKVRDYRVFVWIYYELVYLVSRKYHATLRLKKELCIIGLDSTFVLLKSAFSRYGYCTLTGRKEDGIKIHLAAILSQLTIPITAIVTPGNVSDSSEFDCLLNDVGLFIDLHKVILVFDKGYWNYKRFTDLTLKHIRFIVPMKKGAKYKVLREKRGEQYRDMIIRLWGVPVELRLVIIYTQEGNLAYLTDIFDLTPIKLHQAYTQRWDMEVFNKEIKSNLHIQNFIGKSLNAILIQIFSTLIVYVLLALFRIFHNGLLPLIEIKRIIRYYGFYSLLRISKLFPKAVSFN